MNEHAHLNALIGAEESTRMLAALQRGAKRRDVLAMVMAGGTQATLAGSTATLATTASAQTPRKGGRCSSPASMGTSPGSRVCRRFPSAG